MITNSSEGVKYILELRKRSLILLAEQKPLRQVVDKAEVRQFSSPGGHLK